MLHNSKPISDYRCRSLLQGEFRCHNYAPKGFAYCSVHQVILTEQGGYRPAIPIEGELVIGKEYLIDSRENHDGWITWKDSPEYDKGLDSRTFGPYKSNNLFWFDMIQELKSHIDGAWIAESCPSDKHLPLIAVPKISFPRERSVTHKGEVYTTKTVYVRFDFYKP